MDILAVVDGVAFYETGYARNGRYRAYSEARTVTLEGKRRPIHRAIGYAKAAAAQRKRFTRYDAHHVDGNHANNTWSNIQLVTAETHRKM